MTEIFKPRSNMAYNDISQRWTCRDKNGRLVCDGGPSQIFSDDSWQFFDTVIGHHRLDGPATSSGFWYINDEDVTKEIKIFAKENDIDLENLTDEDKVLIALHFY